MFTGASTTVASCPFESISTGETGRTLSLDDSFASERLLQDVGTRGGFTPGPRTGQWALVVGLSKGWQNYRHQADALAQYQMLRAHGVSDDHIVLVLADDLAGDPRNAEPGVVRNVAGGPRSARPRGGRLSDRGPRGRGPALHPEG